jgi:mRNA interferase MazF
MKKRGYVPDRGDIVWLQFNPQSGHEQAGHRPALVLSPADYNRASGLMLCCPMTSQKKGYPFEVVISDDPDRTSVVLADQVKSVDWKTRQAVKKGSASPNVVMETLSKLHALLEQ